jgi:hypothetical protein
MSNKEKKCKLGSKAGYTNAGDEAVNPVNNELAISQWHAALSRVIAYVWDQWDNDEEINNVLRYPEYYLAKFGFHPQIPAYQTKIKFVIKPNDTVLYKYGGIEDDLLDNGQLDLSTCDKDGATIVVLPQGNPAEKRVSNMNRAMEYRSAKNVYTAGLVPLSGLSEAEREKEIRQTLKDDDNALENGWQFDQVNELTGCFIVAIPPKPEVHPDSIADQNLIESQALGDFMDICRSQPFTCS